MAQPSVRPRLALILLLLGVCSARPAHAALTDSEKAVVRTFVKKGALESASRVRALVARPDLSPEEIATVLREGYGTTPFDDAHARFTDALLFGEGSAASRNGLVPGVVTGLLARAASRMSDVPLGPTERVGEAQRSATAEVLAIHAFVDEKIANGGSPPPDGHDGSLAIRDDAFGAAARAYAEHLGNHERWMRAPGPVSAELARVRVQLSLTLVDLSRGILGRHELAGPLGLAGARLGFFERTGVLLEPGGAPEARVAEVVRLVEGIPGATAGLAAIVLPKVSPLGLVGRGKVLRVGVAFGEKPNPTNPGVLWPAEVTPSSPDKGMVAVAEAVADHVTRRALAQDPAFATRARAAAEHATRAGAAGFLGKRALAVPLAGALRAPPDAPPASAVLASAVALLLLDAPRAVELAAIREGEGRPEAAEQLALALTVLAGSGKGAMLGRTRDDGAVEPFALSDVKRDGGLVTEAKLGDRRVTVVANADSVFTVALDGTRPKLTALADFRERLVEAESWESDRRTFKRLFGAPRAAALDDGRLVIEGSHAGFDALEAGEPGADGEIAAELRPSGAGGGLALRAAAGESSYEAVVLLLEPADSRIRLLVMDGKGRGRPLAEPVPLAAGTGVHQASLAIRGSEVVASVDKRTLRAKLTDGPSDGRPGIVVRSDARLEVRKLTVKQKAP